MTPPIDRLTHQPLQSANRPPIKDTPSREAARKVRQAQDEQRQKAQESVQAKTQADAAQQRLQIARAEEEQARQRVRTAKVDQEEAAGASRRPQPGDNINVVV